MSKPTQTNTMATSPESAEDVDVLFKPHKPVVSGKNKEPEPQREADLNTQTVIQGLKQLKELDEAKYNALVEKLKEADANKR